MASHRGHGTQRDRTELVTVSPSGVHVSKPGDPRDAGETQLLWKDDLEVLGIVVAKNQSETRHVQTERVWLRAWLVGGNLSLPVCAHSAQPQMDLRSVLCPSIRLRQRICSTFSNLRDGLWTRLATYLVR